MRIRRARKRERINLFRASIRRAHIEGPKEAGDIDEQRTLGDVLAGTDSTAETEGDGPALFGEPGTVVGCVSGIEESLGLEDVGFRVLDWV